MRVNPVWPSCVGPVYLQGRAENYGDVASMSPMIKKTYYAYYYLMVVLGFSVLAFSIFHMLTEAPNIGWVILASLTALSGHFSIKLPKVKSKISIADAFIFTSIILFGPEVGSVTAALEGILGSFRSHAHLSRRLRYTLFNIAAMATSAYVSGKVLFGILRVPPLYGGKIAVLEIILPALAMALVHYLSNTISVAIIVSLETREYLLKVWWERFHTASLTYFAGASAAAIIVTNIHDLSISSLGLILPILFITYFAYKTYLDKAEENAHRLQLDKLYLRTVEVLSVAIDARESGTLGHSKRVQTYARGLAKAANIVNEKINRGIEAAALLLDIGNLAIPEYILNNPGELSSTEMQKVRIHPVVGANILSNIDFPYPLTEFVRHHHERWDGSGYPDMLKGEQIPLGARILSIADCFDALTCERFYRKSYSKEQAMLIIRSRTGTYYDPSLVDVFERIIDDLVAQVKEIEASGAKSEWQRGIANSSGIAEWSSHRSDNFEVFGAISSTRKEVSVLYELTQALGSTLSVQDSLAIIASKLAEIVHFDTCVIYSYAEEESCLWAEYVSGANADVLKGHHLRVEQSLSGWVMTEKEPVFNANAAMDLASVEKELTVSLENALVYPLVLENRCTRTISLYSTRERKFNGDDLRILMTVAPKAAAAVQNAMRFEEAHEMAVTDPLTSLPNMRQFNYFFEKELAKSKRHAYPISILGMDLDGFKSVNDQHGHAVGDQILVEVSKLLKSILRAEDLVVRSGGDEFIAALVQTNYKDAIQLSNRIQNAIDAFQLEIASGEIVHVGISMGCASYPEHGEMLEELMKKADNEMYRNKAERRTRFTRLVAGSASN
jgi:diguanylate cyclase (GGDEF)-like protein